MEKLLILSGRSIQSLEKICIWVKSEINWLNVELGQEKLDDFNIYCPRAIKKDTYL
jgi:hypothetical protein